MSQVYEDLGAEYNILVGTIKLFDIVVMDGDSGQPMDITDTGVFATAEVRLYKPNGNLICAPIVAQYGDREESTITFTAGVFPNNLAGNWKGVAQMYNSSNQLINQQFFNFNVERVR